MNGVVAVLHDKGWAVSNNALLDYEKEIIDTPEGRRSVGRSVFTVKDVFGGFLEGSAVKVAFQAEDGKCVAYRCMVESSTRLVILEQLNEYKQIVQEVLSWQQ